MKGGDAGSARGTPRSQLRSCCDMSFEGLSPELMLCVRIRRERLWCSWPASKQSRQVLRRLVDQTAWNPNSGSRRVLRPILPRTEVSERQPPFCQDARTQIDRPSRDVRTHRAKENTCDNHFARCFSQVDSGIVNLKKVHSKSDCTVPFSADSCEMVVARV